MPIPRCCFPGCFNRKTKRNSQLGSDHMNFYTFPKTAEVRTQWKILCGKPAECDADQYMVCSDHFMDSDFEDDSQTRILRSGRRRLLKSDAMPRRCMKKKSRAQSDRLMNNPDVQRIEGSLLEDEVIDVEGMEEDDLEQVGYLAKTEILADSDEESSEDEENRPTVMIISSSDMTPDCLLMDEETITFEYQPAANDPANSASGVDFGGEGVEINSSPQLDNRELLPLESNSTDLLNLWETLKRERADLQKTKALLQIKVMHNEKQLKKLQNGVELHFSNIFKELARDLETNYPSIPKKVIEKISQRRLKMKIKYQPEESNNTA